MVHLGPSTKFITAAISRRRGSPGKWPPHRASCWIVQGREEPSRREACDLVYDRGFFAKKKEGQNGHAHTGDGSAVMRIDSQHFFGRPRALSSDHRSPADRDRW